MILRTIPHTNEGATTSTSSPDEVAWTVTASILRHCGRSDGSLRPRERTSMLPENQRAAARHSVTRTAGVDSKYRYVRRLAARTRKSEGIVDALVK